MKWKSGLFKLIFLAILFNLPILAFAQVQTELLNEKILWDGIIDELKLEIIERENLVSLRVNDRLVEQIELGKNSKTNFLTSKNNSSFALLLYSFGGKSEKSYIKVKIYDIEFKLVNEFNFEFFYEEPFPIFRIGDSGDLVLLYPDKGLVETVGSNSGKIFLEKNIIQDAERIGHLIFSDDDIIIGLSNLEKRDDSYSKIYFLDKSLNIRKTFLIEANQLHKIFKISKDQLLISAYNFVNKFEPKMILLRENKISTIGNFLAEKLLKEKDLFIIGKKLIHQLDDVNLIETFRVNENREIIDVYDFDGRRYILTKEGNNFYIIISSYRFQIEKELYVENSTEIKGFFYSKTNNKLFLITKDNFLKIF